MAKTTSQIIAENQVKRAEAAALGEQLSKIHQQQMAQVGSKNATRTAAVLENAIAGTTGASQKKSLERAYSNIEKDAKKNGVQIRRSTPRDEQIALKNAPETKKQTRDRTKKEYDDYVKSDEYKKRVTENDQKARAEAAAQMFLNPGHPMSQPKVIQDEREMQLRAAMESAEKEYNASEDNEVIAEDLEAITGLSNEERKELEQYAVNQIRDQNLPVEMVGVMPTAQQEASGLIGKYGKQRVDEMAETFMRQENAELAKRTADKAGQVGHKGGLFGFLDSAIASAATVPVTALSGLVGTVGQLQGMARNTGRYQSLDPYATGTIGDTFTGAVRGQVQQNIEQGLGGGFLGKAASVGYQGIMSAADSIARAVLGGGAVGGAALAATGSFSQTMAEASRQGASPAQAALLATVNSGIEALSEKIPLDNLIRTAKGTGAKTVLLNALRQMGIEATTEEISLLGTVLAEAAILQEKSAYKQDIISGITSGMSADDAIIEANKKILGEALNTLLVSAVSGGASSLSGSYADARGLFAQEQEQNNPALNQPKQSDVVKSVEDLRQKYGQPEAQQVQSFDAEQDRLTAPISVQNALKNVKVNDDPMADRSVEFRLVDIDAIKKDPESMQWLAKRGLVGNMEIALGRLRNGEYRVSNANIKTRQPEQTKPKTMQYGQKVKAGDRGNIGTVLSYDPSTNSYLVNFRSKSGTTKNVRLSASELAPVGKIIQPKTQTFQPVKQGAQATQQPQQEAQPVTPEMQQIEAALAETLGVQPVQTTDNSTGNKSVKLYRGYNQSDDPTKKNLTKQQSVYNILGREDPNEIKNLLPLAYYTENEEDARSYADMDVRQMDEYRKNGIYEYRDRVMRGKDVEGLSEEEYADRAAKRSFMTMHGREPNAGGRVERYDYTPGKVLDLTELGEMTNVDAAYKVLADKFGIEPSELDNILTMGNNFENDFPAFALLRNTPRDNIGTKIVDLAKKAGYDSIRYSEDGNSHYAIITDRQDWDKNLIKDKGFGYYDEFEDWGKDPNREGVENPLSDRSYSEVGKRSVKAYMYENPAVKPFYQEQAAWLLSELADSTKGERTYNEQLHYESGGEQGWSGTKRHTSESIAELLDQDGMSYDQIERGLNAIVNDHGQENNAVSKRIEFVINDRLMNGYTDFYTGEKVPGNGEYLNLLRNKQSAPDVDTSEAVQMGASNQSAEGGQQTQTQQEAPEMQRDRINAVREQEVTVTDPQGGKVSEFAGNAYQSSLTPDSFTDSIKRLVEEGQVSHDVQTNEESLRKGAEMIAKAGTERKAVNEIRDFANSGKFTPEHIAMGTLLYQDLTAQIDQQAKNGNVDTNLQQDAEDVFVSLQQMATNSGRALQLYNLFRKMTPESQVNVLEREVQRNIEKMQKAGTVKKGYQSSIDPELTNMYRQAADEFQKAKGADAKKFAEQKMQDIQSVIYASEAAKLPTTFKAKWDAWRYMAMLGNVKTQIRNLAGNAAMIPYTGVKRRVGAILEAGTGLDKSQRTKSLVVDKQLMQWAKQDAVNVKSVLDGSAKLGDSTAKNPMAEGVKTFGDSWIGERFNELQGIIDKTVSGGDMLFKNREYTRSLAGFLKARGYTAADVQTEGRVPVDVMNEARNYAVNEALKATFNDTNVLSDALANGLRYKGDNPVMKAINTLGEGIMPFRKTPANVVMRFKDYSPAGLVQGMWNAAVNVRNGKVSAATAIDQLASGLTGTAVMAFGYMLAGGIGGVKITGSGTDEDEKRQNHQNYALEFSVNGQEYSYTIDWASPANLPLFLGANLREMNEAQDTASFITALVNAGRGALEPLLQLSCLSSLNDMFEAARYAEEGEALYTFAAMAATSYLTQGIPSIARQATQAGTENKQTTFTTTDDPVLQDVQKTVAGLGVGTPYKTDKRNAWGEKEVQGEVLSSITGLPVEVTRAIDAFFNPGTLKKIDNSAVEKEITRLNKAGQDVTPNTAARTISYIDKDGTGHDDVRLTEEQYQTLAETQGQTARKLVEDMIQSKAYQALTDEQKAEAIDAAYLYARKTGEIAAIGESHTGYDQSWMYDVNKGGGANELMRRVFNSSLNTSMSDLDNAWDKGYNEETFSRDMEEAYDSYQKAPAAMKRQVYEEASGTAKKYMEARDKGLTHKEVISAIESVVKVHGTGAVNKETGKPTVRDIDRRKAIASTPGLSESAKDILMKAYMADYDPSDESPETTEFKYDYARKEMGLSATEYADTYKAYLDSSKKRDKIAAIRALGYDYGTAQALYDLYNGRKKNELIKLYG